MLTTPGLGSKGAMVRAINKIINGRIGREGGRRDRKKKKAKNYATTAHDTAQRPSDEMNERVDHRGETFCLRAQSLTSGGPPPPPP